MVREFELRELLKSQSLDEVKPSAFASVGGVVFPDEPAKFDLADFVDVVDSYRAVHVPTYGNAIPNTTTTETATLTDSQQVTTLLEVPNNQTYRILGIAVRTADNYGMGSAGLGVNGKPIIDLTDIDTLTNRFSKVILDNDMNLILTGGASLSYLCQSTPSSDVKFDVTYHVLQQ